MEHELRTTKTQLQSTVDDRLIVATNSAPHRSAVGFNRRKMEDQRRQGGQQMVRGVDFDVFTGE